MNKILGSGLVVSALLVGCSQIEAQPIGDMVAGAGGRADRPTSPAGGRAGSPTSPAEERAGSPASPAGGSSGSPALPVGGRAGSSTLQGSGGEPTNIAGSGTLAGAGGESGEQCGEAVCDPNADCFVAPGASTDEGICTPLCNPADQTDQTGWGLPCSGAVGGGQGVCRAFNRTYEINPEIGVANTPVGVCTIECDPLAQNCPDGFTCELTDTPRSTRAVWSFACLPNLKPLETGAACDGAPLGQCSKGATCNSHICQEFCDSTAADPCPSGGTCIVEEWFPAGSTVGVCVD